MTFTVWRNHLGCCGGQLGGDTDGSGEASREAGGHSAESLEPRLETPGGFPVLSGGRSPGRDHELPECKRPLSLLVTHSPAATFCLGTRTPPCAHRPTGETQRAGAGVERPARPAVRRARSSRQWGQPGEEGEDHGRLWLESPLCSFAFNCRKVHIA